MSTFRFFSILWATAAVIGIGVAALVNGDYLFGLANMVMIAGLVSVLLPALFAEEGQQMKQPCEQDARSVDLGHHFKSDEWHAVADAINIVQTNFHRFVTTAAPVPGSGEICSHAEAIEDELRSLFNSVRDRMNDAALSECASTRGE